MTTETLRSITLTRTGPCEYEASNGRGGRLTLSSGETPHFTPVELLLTAMAGCSAVDVDLLTARLAEPTRFDVAAEAEKVRDEHGNHLTGLHVTFDVRFPVGEAGDKARTVLPSAIEKSRDRLCTVGRTVQVGAPITYSEGELTPPSPS